MSPRPFVIALAVAAVSYPSAGAQAGIPQQHSSGVVSVTDGASLENALAAAQPGTHIALAAGVYTSRHQFTISTACTAAAPCVLSGSRSAVLDGGGLDGHYGLHLQGAAYWTVQGVTVDNASKGVVLDASSHNVLASLAVHDIGDEGIHLRDFSSHNVVRNSIVHATGLGSPQYGEGIYIGSAVSNWGTYSGGKPDRSDWNQIRGNRVYATGAESVDIKEGTSHGTLTRNSFDGAGMSGQNSADSWVDVKGNYWRITSNTGAHALQDGFQTHVLAAGWGRGNTFSGNHADVDGPGYGFYVYDPGATVNVVSCDNVVTNAGSGTSNEACTP